MAAAMALILTGAVLIGCTNLAVAWKEAELIHVGGKVMCQDCTKGYNEWVAGDRPIKGCKVSVTCMDERGRAMYYASDLTDELGHFEMTLSKYINGKQLKEKLCSVRLVSSPDPTCNILTDFAGGKSGVKLRGPTLVYRDMVKYMLGPFFFTTPTCDQPDTIDDDEGSHY